MGETNMLLNDNEIKRLQSVCMEMLEEVDRICRKNNIKYSLCGGTLLGAVREHGFISWDDDADLAFTRDQYELFVEACKKDLNHERYYLQDHDIEPEYPWGYAKVRMHGTKLVQKGQTHLKFRNGIFLDVFIYDHVPDGKLSRKFHYFKCYCIRKCQYSVVGKYNAKSAFMRGWYHCIDKIPKKWLFSELNRMAKKWNKRDTELCRHLTFPYFRKECKYGLPTKCFDGYMDADFEGRKLMIVKGYDTVLSLKYGDYMTPPPPSEITYYPIHEIVFPE